MGEIDFDRIINFKEEDFIDRVSPVYTGIKKTKEKLKNKNLIGFAGAAWTLLVYMINKDPQKKFQY